MKGGLDRRLGVAPSDATSPEPRRNHSAVVDDQAITLLEQIRKISNGAIFQNGGTIRLHYQKARGVAWARRPQGDAIGGQVKIE